MTRPVYEVAAEALDRAYQDQIGKLFGVLAVASDVDKDDSDRRFDEGFNKLTRHYLACASSIEALSKGEGNA